MISPNVTTRFTDAEPPIGQLFLHISDDSCQFYALGRSRIGPILGGVTPTSRLNHELK